MRSMILAAGAMVGAVVAQPATAATTVLQKTNCIQFCLFDPFVAGTINSIAYSVTYNNFTTFRALPNGPQDTSVTARVTGTTTFLGAPGSVSVNEVQTSPIVGDSMVSFGTSGSYNVTILSNFGYFTGGQFLAGASSNLTVTQLSGAALGAATFGRAISSVTLLVDYTPAVPEPSTWALMLAGFGLTGYVLRRRRAAVAFA